MKDLVIQDMNKGLLLIVELEKEREIMERKKKNILKRDPINKDIELLMKHFNGIWMIHEEEKKFNLWSMLP